LGVDGCGAGALDDGGEGAAVADSGEGGGDDGVGGGGWGGGGVGVGEGWRCGGVGSGVARDERVARVWASSRKRKGGGQHGGTGRGMCARCLEGVADKNGEDGEGNFFQCHCSSVTTSKHDTPAS